MERSLCWLASFPKSGNTWLRIVIENLLATDGMSVGINRISVGAAVNGRAFFDEIIGTNSDELTGAEIEQLRPRVYRHLAQRTSGRMYCKTHEAYRPTVFGTLRPADAFECAVYVIRNPFDLVSSCAVFFDKPIDQMIDLMASSDHALSAAPDRFHPMLCEQLGTWSEHVAGWLDASRFPRLVIRYEDMVLAPSQSYAQIAEFLGLPHDAASIMRTIEATRFATLRGQEELVGFRENASGAPSFFRRGRIGEWTCALSGGQIARLRAAHDAIMRRVGYLDAAGEPTALILPKEQH
jgi:Sulfotransferase domain